MAQSHAPHGFDRISLPPAVNHLLVWFSIGALLLALPLAFNIASRLQAEARMRAEVERMTQEVNAAETKLAGLRAALGYARSEAFAEEWARARARWSKDGEVIVVPPMMRKPSHLWWESFLK
ncbi:MAG: hypothetical protein D6709_02430 [Chloroflexi bacterium]|uniref:Septum formation initiator n=1 Tax=Candidatus Thermofonsia Clade 3 bacterium TaxID=2364212 RepID=A0A2M8QA30_9CHLR|nr:MAG: hypothetical protein CUN48_12670 [Candidatus Thermofonsia Clade 3 bacterium]RMG65500.1 MAG: hypothetical protein D6709_02430 [Chloroflexota bacterium]